MIKGRKDKKAMKIRGVKQSCRKLYLIHIFWMLISFQHGCGEPAVQFGGNGSSDVESRLITTLFSGYHKAARPVRHHKDSVQVRCKISIVHIETLVRLPPVGFLS